MGNRTPLSLRTKCTTLSLSLSIGGQNIIDRSTGRSFDSSVGWSVRLNRSANPLGSQPSQALLFFFIFLFLLFLSARIDFVRLCSVLFLPRQNKNGHDKIKKKKKIRETVKSGGGGEGRGVEHLWNASPHHTNTYSRHAHRGHAHRGHAHRGHAHCGHASFVVTYSVYSPYAPRLPRRPPNNSTPNQTHPPSHVL